MKHCTVCGAEAREGAKFCTSCGARLQDTGKVSASETATLPTVLDAAEASADVTPEFGTDDTGRDDAERASSSETVMYVPEQDETDKPVEPPFAASWPTDDTSNALDDPEERAAPEPPALASSEPASWASTFVSPEPVSTDPEADDTQAAPDATAPDNAGSEWSWAAAQDASSEGAAGGVGDEAPSDEESGSWAVPDDTSSTPGFVEDAAPVDRELEADHSGASTWESWAPSAGGPSALGERQHDPAGDIRGLLSDLADRIDRVLSPSTLESRRIDPEDLADQLDRWSRPVPDTDELLAVVQDVRKSPRDLDAIARLADHAADLELLVRHYQSITASSGRWATALREERDTTSDGSST